MLAVMVRMGIAVQSVVHPGKSRPAGLREAPWRKSRTLTTTSAQPQGGLSNSNSRTKPYHKREIQVLKLSGLGLPWRSSGWDSALSLQGAWVQSLVGELESHKLRGQKIKHKNNKIKWISQDDLAAYLSMTATMEKYADLKKAWKGLSKFK